MKQLAAALFLVLAGALAAAAATDVSGKWTGDIPRRDGGADATTFDLTIDGEKVGGTVTTPVATYTIKEGHFKDEELEFFIIVSMGRDVRFVYTGKVAGEQINFVREIQGMALRTPFIAKRPK